MCTVKRVHGGACSPVVVTLHLVVEHLALLGGGVGDKFRLDDLQDVIADVGQLRLNLRLVVTDKRQLVALGIRDNSNQMMVLISVWSSNYVIMTSDNTQLNRIRRFLVILVPRFQFRAVAQSIFAMMTVTSTSQ